MTPSNRLNRDALDQILRGQLDLITRAQARAVGLTNHALQHRLRPGGPWHSLLPSVYMTHAGPPTYGQEEMAALLYAGPGSVITGSAALRCHHIRGAPSNLVDVLVPVKRQRRDVSFTRLHRTTRVPERVWSFGPLRYALPARAVADTARAMTSLRDVRAIVADAVQRGRCGVQQLASELVAGPKVGSALLREALTDVADGIRSAAEGDLKDLLARSGLPMPLFNAMVFAGEEFVAQLDGWWPEFGVGLEVDSQEWHMSPEDHANTLSRGRRIGIHQVIVLRFTPKQVRAEPRQVIEEIRRTLEGARSRPPLNLRTVPASPDRNVVARRRL